MANKSFEAIKIALKQDSNGFVLTLRIHPDEMPEGLLRDYVGARYGVAMMRINDDETMTTVEKQEPDARVIKAGILCRNWNFWKFLSTLLEVEVSNEEQAVENLCNLLNIHSRTELRSVPYAQETFDKVVQDYENQIPQADF